MSNNFKVGFYYHVDPDGKKKLEFANIAERRSFAVCKEKFGSNEKYIWKIWI